ncbi:MAG: hypothetical protein MRY32_09315 [Rickettsiales bacterium]|nr:hypothetical protein [Rickettsiales bacterium]
MAKPKTLADVSIEKLSTLAKAAERNAYFQHQFAVALLNGQPDQAKLLLDHAKTLKDDKAIDLSLITGDKLANTQVTLSSGGKKSFSELAAVHFRDVNAMLKFEADNSEVTFNTAMKEALTKIKPYRDTWDAIENLKAGDGLKLAGSTELKIPEDRLGVIQQEMLARLDTFARTGKAVDPAELTKFRDQLQADATKWAGMTLENLTKSGGPLHKSGSILGFNDLKKEIYALEPKADQKLGGSTFDLSDPAKADIIRAELARQLNELATQVNDGKLSLQDLRTKQTELGTLMKEQAGKTVADLSAKFPEASKKIAPALLQELAGDLGKIESKAGQTFGDAKIDLDPAKHALIMNEMGHRLKELGAKGTNLTAADVYAARNQIESDLKNWQGKDLKTLQEGPLKGAVQRIQTFNEAHIDKDNAATIAGQPASGVLYKVDKDKMTVTDKEGKALKDTDLATHQKALVDLITATRRQADPKAELKDIPTDPAKFQDYINTHRELLTKSEAGKPALLGADGKLDLKAITDRGIGQIGADGKATPFVETEKTTKDRWGLDKIDPKKFAEGIGAAIDDKDTIGKRLDRTDQAVALIDLFRNGKKHDDAGAYNKYYGIKPGETTAGQPRAMIEGKEYIDAKIGAMAEKHLNTLLAKMVAKGEEVKAKDGTVISDGKIGISKEEAAYFKTVADKYFSDPKAIRNWEEKGDAPTQKLTAEANAASAEAKKAVAQAKKDAGATR